MILYYVGNEPKLKEAMISFFEEIQAEYQLLSDEDLEQTIESLLVKTSLNLQSKCNNEDI